MPDNISSTRIEPLGSGVGTGAEKEAEFARGKERRKVGAAEKKAASPLVELESEEEHQLDEQA